MKDITKKLGLEDWTLGTVESDGLSVILTFNKPHWYRKKVIIDGGYDGFLDIQMDGHYYMEEGKWLDE